MTSVVANKIGLDIVDIQVEQTGSAETDMFFQEPVLDHSRDYVVGVSELSIPLSHESMLTNKKALQGEVFLEFRRKRLLNNTMIGVNHQNGHEADNRARFYLRDRTIQSPADLVQALCQFVYSFQQYITTVANGGAAGGIHNVAYTIQLLSTPSGIFKFRGNANFWLDYVLKIGSPLQVTNSGYAKEILGYKQDYIGVGLIGGVLTTQESVLIGGNPDTWVASGAGFVSAAEVQMRYSIYRYAEHRLRVDIDADLAIPSNIMVENGQQKMHYNIASYALPQKYEGRITVNASPVITETVSHISHLFAGNTIVKPKETPTTDWYTLASAANVQNMRLHVFVVRREWNMTTRKWTLVRNKLTMQDGLGNKHDSTWFLTMKFIQTF